MPGLDETTGQVVRWLLAPSSLFLAAVIAGLVEVARRTGWPANLSAALAVGLGLVGAILYVAFYGPNGGRDRWTPDVGTVLMQGLTLGLLASGVFGTLRELARVALGQETVHGAPLVERRGPGEQNADVRPPRAPGAAGGELR